MHSGIGPAAELQRFNLPVIHNLPAVGKRLLDHPSIILIVQRRKETSDRGDFYGNKENFDAAVRQWQADASGTFRDYNW